MNNCTLLPPGQILAFGAEAAERLLAQDHGDAALLYLHLLRHNNPFPKNWDLARIRHSQAVLLGMGMLPPEFQGDLALPNHLPKEVSVIPPSYTTEDLNTVMSDEDGEFRNLANTVEEQFGKSLTSVDLKLLLEIYSHLELPAGVILMVVTTCISRQLKANTSRKRPSMKDVQNEARFWQNKGIVTMEAAMAYTNELVKMDHQQDTILQMFHLERNHITNAERDYIKQWNEWGFPLETYPLAYERCLIGEKNHSFKWAYTSGIFKNWHQRNLHSLEEILGAEGSFQNQKRPGSLYRSPKTFHAQETSADPETVDSAVLAKRMQDNYEAIKRMSDKF